MSFILISFSFSLFFPYPSPPSSLYLFVCISFLIKVIAHALHELYMSLRISYEQTFSYRKIAVDRVSNFPTLTPRLIQWLYSYIYLSSNHSSHFIISYFLNVQYTYIDNNIYICRYIHGLKITIAEPTKLVYRICSMRKSAAKIAQSRQSTIHLALDILVSDRRAKI